MVELNSQASILTDAIYEADYIMNSNFNNPYNTQPQKWTKRKQQFQWKDFRRGKNLGFCFINDMLKKDYI